LKKKNLEWFPRMRAMSLDASGKAEEDNELSNIKIRLEFTNNLVASLSKQLDELNERVKIFLKYFFSTAFPLKHSNTSLWKHANFVEYNFIYIHFN